VQETAARRAASDDHSFSLRGLTSEPDSVALPSVGRMRAGSRQSLREQGVEAPARSFLHPPAIHCTEKLGRVPGGHDHLRAQIGPGSPLGQMTGRAAGMISSLVHLMAL
jgi:hypothetical protein